jgi:hypothetical protein
MPACVHTGQATKRSLGALVYSRSIILALNPKDAGACYNRGSVDNRKFDRDWAISDFDQAIRLNPNYDQV